jgi:hypothetical protein
MRQRTRHKPIRRSHRDGQLADHRIFHRPSTSAAAGQRASRTSSATMTTTVAMKISVSILDMRHIAHRLCVRMVRNLDDFGQLQISLQAGVARSPHPPSSFTVPWRATIDGRSTIVGGPPSWGRSALAPRPLNK